MFNMDLGDRMKRYEAVNNVHLTDRLPVIIRVDGNAFHSYTRGLSKNDEKFSKAMNNVAIVLCSKISGARLAYVQSDEISILLNPWNDNNSAAWFDNKLQKLVSISASIAGSTLTLESSDVFEDPRAAYFDSRAFVMPYNEVVNYYIWRQQDTIRNSIQVLGQMNFSHKQLHKKSCGDIKDMLYKEKGINWEDASVGFKHGRCIIKKDFEINTPSGLLTRSKWFIDKNIPIFLQDRSYIEDKIWSKKEND